MSKLKHALLGAARPVARTLTAGCGRILMYHRFGRPGMFRRMPVDVFEAQIRYLSRHYRIVPLRELVASVRNGGVKGGTVAITVDDGYEDFVQFAYPVLQKYRVPATIYLVSGFVARQLWLWFDAIHYLVCSAAPGQYRLDLGIVRTDATLGDAASRNQLWDRLADACLPLEPQVRSRVLNDLAAQLRVPLPTAPTSEYAAMSWEQARSLDPKIVELGAHTLSHPILSRCTREEQQHEIQSGRRMIEGEVQREVTNFCYPNGQPGDFNADTIELLRGMGFASAVVAHGSMIRAGADPFTLERLAAPDEMSEFRRLVDGITEVRLRMSASLGRSRRLAPDGEAVMRRAY